MHYEAVYNTAVNAAQGLEGPTRYAFTAKDLNAAKAYCKRKIGVPVEKIVEYDPNRFDDKGMCIRLAEHIIA